MGLLSKLFGKHTNSDSSIEEKLYETDPEYAKLKDELDKQDEELALLLSARESYSEDENIEKIIKVYESVFITGKSTLNSNCHRLYLADLYIKANQNDKAWGYLNSMIIGHPDITDKIRSYQCKTLKREKKYAETMKFLMLSYLYKSKWNNTFKEDMFIKEATPIANKLKWDSATLADVSKIIKSQVDKKNYDEKVLIGYYQKLLASL